LTINDAESYFRDREQSREQPRCPYCRRPM
jgi:hypothetical protein